MFVLLAKSFAKCAFDCEIEQFCWFFPRSIHLSLLFNHSLVVVQWACLGFYQNHTISFVSIFVFNYQNPVFLGPSKPKSYEYKKKKFEALFISKPCLLRWPCYAFNSLETIFLSFLIILKANAETWKTFSMWNNV